MCPEPQILIDPLSTQSLLIELYVNGNALSTATGIIVQRDGTDYLVTNWHVLSGRHPESGEPLSPTLGIPDEIRILHHARNRLGSWVVRSEPLVNAEGAMLWVEHARSSEIDVAALRLTTVDDEVQLYPFDLALADTDMIPEPAMPISILGFPFGLSAGGAWPIWKTGHIATDPDIDFETGKPAFLIDATTRGGMSGSPVVLRMHSGFRTRSGARVLGAGVQTKLLGIYSGRIREDVEIGRVWRPSVIGEVLDNA